MRVAASNPDPGECPRPCEQRRTETVGVSTGCQGLPCVYQRSKRFIDRLHSHSHPMSLVASPSLVPVLQIRQVMGLAQGKTVHSSSVTWTRPSVFRVLTLIITLKITL